MFKKKFQGHWTVLVLSNAKSPVIHLKFTKAFVAILSIIITILILTLTFSLSNTTKLGIQNKKLNNELSLNDQQQSELSKNQIELENKAAELEHKVQKLTEMEKQLKEIIQNINPNEINNKDEYAQQGGPELTPNYKGNSTLIKNNFTDQTLTVKAKLKRMNDILPKLTESYATTIENGEKLKKQLTHLPTFWPSNSYQITSTFGNRKDPFSQKDSYHEGLDIAGKLNSPIFAAASGEVTFANVENGYGNVITIKHNSALETKYAHLENILVQSGDYVKKGQLIGEMGSTGRSTGVHLHFEIIKNGEKVDPYPFITSLN